MDYLHDRPLPSFPFPPLPGSDETASIPLRCNICSKKPKFSDISHLLTHIASKGHLSTYYKVKIKSATDREARSLIEEYDAWYADNGIESLMSERMNSKEARRKQRVRQSGLAVPPVPPKSQQHQPICQTPRHTYALEDATNPFLLHSAVKQENTEHISLQSGEERLPHRYGFPVTSASWMPGSYHYDGGPMGMAEYPGGDEENEVNSNSLYSPCPSRLSHFNTSTDSGLFDLDDIGDLDEDGGGNEYSRLKGILWPGMDMFDSATPLMRRKRNQKKSADVIERLEALSRGIEATEAVYNADGDLQKERPITGYPHSDSSPLMGEPTPPPKRQRPAPRRKPLAPKDSNARPATRSTTARSKKDEPLRRSSTRASKQQRNDEAAYARPGGTAQTRRNATARRSAKADASPAFEPLSVTTESHPLTYLTSAFQYRPSSQSESSTSQFRPAMDWVGYNHLPMPGSPAYSSTLSNDSTLLPAWDYLGHDVGSALMNPLFMEGVRAAADAEDMEADTVVGSICDG